MCCGDVIMNAIASDGGSPDSTQPVMRPCAEITRIWRFTLKRSRMTAARLSSTSARLPPLSRCVSTAVTKNRASSSRHALGDRLQRIGERHAEVLLVVEQPELAGHRLRHLVGDHAQPGREGVAGAQRAGDQVDRFRELLLELPQPLGRLVPDDGERQPGEQRADGEAEPGSRVIQATSSHAPRNRHAEASTSCPTVICMSALGDLALKRAGDRRSCAPAPRRAPSPRSALGLLDEVDALGRPLSPATCAAACAACLARRPRGARSSPSRCPSTSAEDDDEGCGNEDHGVSSGHHLHVLEHLRRQREARRGQLALHFGRMPVARNMPVTRPSGVSPVRSNRKMSCIVITSPSIPVISVTPVTRRVPSDIRESWTTRLTAEATCWRTALSGMLRLAIATIVSRRYSASRGLLAWIVVRLPSWPVFMACSMSSASSPRTSPTTMRSGRMRRALMTSSRWLHRALALDVGRARLEPHHVPLPQHQLGGVFDGDDALAIGDEAREHVEERGLAGAGAARDEDVEARADRRLEEVQHRLRQRLALDEVLGAEPVGAEPADRQHRAVERQRRNDRVDTRAVGQARVHHRARLVDAPAHRADDALDDAQQVLVVLEDDVGLFEPALALDVDLVGAVDQDVGDRRVAQEAPRAARGRTAR